MDRRRLLSAAVALVLGAGLGACEREQAKTGNPGRGAVAGREDGNNPAKATQTSTQALSSGFAGASRSVRAVAHTPPLVTVAAAAVVLAL